MTTYDIEKVILEQEAVGKATFVAHSCNQHVLSFGNLVLLYHADILHQWPLHEADEEHFELKYMIFLFVNIHEALLTHVRFQGVYPIESLPPYALLNTEKDHIELIYIC